MAYGYDATIYGVSICTVERHPFRRASLIKILYSVPGFLKEVALHFI